MLPPKHAERAERLSPAKRALLERWKAARSNQPSGRSIQPRDANCPVPLSFAQQRLWFLDQLSPGSPQYNIATALRLSGPLDAQLLEQSLHQVIQRHEALRTAFRTEAGKPVQVVLPECEFTLSRIDLSAEKPSRLAQRRDEIAREEALLAFDLTSPPLLRATLLKTADDEHTLLLTMHHIISDGWSMAVLSDEVAQCYQSLAADFEPVLSPLPVQFADYAVWQREELTESREGELLQYWAEKLRDAPPHLELPHDFPRPAAQTFEGAAERCTVSPELTEALREYSRGQNATLFMTLLAGFQLVLARYSGQHDVLVGSPIANRTRAELERLIGFFANTLVLRSAVSENVAFNDFLSQVRRTTLDAYAHKDLPLDRLVESLQPERDLSRTPLFQVMFVLQNIPLAERQLDELTVSEVSFDHAPVSSFDATLNVDELDDHLRLSFVYNTSLFTAETAARVLASYEAVLRQIVADPTQKVLELPLVTSDEQKRLLNEWAGPAPTPLPSQCIHELIAEQAARTPDQIAVVDALGSVTYAELDARANRWARYLRKRGITSGSVVAICIDRSTAMITSLLAVLKAGGAYLPLDPEQPSQRLQAMIDDADAQLIITTSKYADRFDPGEAALLEVDLHEKELGPQSAEPLRAIAGPDDLAYIVYTSGSTGAPKGVEIEHRGLVNHALVLAEEYELEPGDGMLQFLSFGFDAAGEEIFPALISGAALHIHPTPRELIGDELLNWSRERRVNVLHIPPPVWESVRMAIEAQGTEAGSHLKTVLSGGEGLSRAKFESWRKLSGVHTKLLYAYGVSEATITSTLFTAAEDVAPSSTERVPIGRAIANQRLYVLDEFQHPVPVGVPGELYIGGIGVARGYRGRPDLTAERFLSLDLGAGEERFYRTGDRVRFLNDGNLEFLGRIDHQIKVRGCRIEPAEIESAIGQHPSVRDVAIVAQDNARTGKRLIAYIAAEGEWSLEPKTMREFLASRLPDPMIPSAFVTLEKLPRGSTGKVDLAALPEPPSVEDEAKLSYRAPTSVEEEQLTESWQSVLGVPRIGVDDNFFALGGDSIQTIQVVAKAADAGLRITPRQMFEHQTIAELALVAEPITETQIDQGPVTGEVPLTPIQQAFFAQDFANPNHFNQAVMLELDPSVTLEMIAKAAEILVTHHDSLRARFERRENGQWQQSYSVPLTPSLETIDLSSLSPEARTAAIVEAAAKWQASLDIATGPLVRFVYFNQGSDQPARLLIVVHHLAIDGVSWRVLIGDLELLCRQLVGKTEAVLPPKTASMRSWVERLEQYAQSSEMEEELGFWQAQTAALATVPPPATNDARNTYATAKTVRRELSEEDTQRLLQEATKTYRTSAAELLLAAVAKSIASETGESGVVVDMEGHGREERFDDVDVSRTVGWFTSLFPLAIQAPMKQDCESWIIAAKEQSRAVPNHGVGYGILRWLAAEKHRSELPAFKPTMVFNYLGSFDQIMPEDSLVRAADESVGPLYDAGNQRPHPWEINAYIRDGRLCIEWTYSTVFDAEQAMENKADQLVAELNLLVEHCLQQTEGRATPSDFPMADVDQQELDRVAALLSQLGD